MWENDLPVVGDSWHKAALRADMALNEDEEYKFLKAYMEIFIESYYDPESGLVKLQADFHGEY